MQVSRQIQWNFPRTYRLRTSQCLCWLAPVHGDFIPLGPSALQDECSNYRTKALGLACRVSSRSSVVCSAKGASCHRDMAVYPGNGLVVDPAFAPTSRSIRGDVKEGCIKQDRWTQKAKTTREGDVCL